jgi:hypothetical protein
MNPWKQRGFGVEITSPFWRFEQTSQQQRQPSPCGAVERRWSPGAMQSMVVTALQSKISSEMCLGFL